MTDAALPATPLIVGTPPALRRAWLRLEIAAGALNSFAARVPVTGLDDTEWTRLIEDHEYARDEFRGQLHAATSLEVSLIERALAL